MARSLAENGLMVDPLGQHAFYSPGYPLLLTPFFCGVRGGHAGRACSSIWRLPGSAPRWSGGWCRHWAAAAARPRCWRRIGYAVWMPSIWSATRPGARKSVDAADARVRAGLSSTVAKGRSDWRAAAVAGCVVRRGLLAGTSVVLTARGFAVALCVRHRTAKPARRWRLPLASFAAGTMLVLTPWLGRRRRRCSGGPVLTTNGAVQPVYRQQSGRDRAIRVRSAETPGRQAAGTSGSRRLGETGTADWLAQETRTWVAAQSRAARRHCR